MEIKEFKFEIYVPEEYIVTIRNELNKIGACKVGDYDNVVSITKVSGYWRPLEHSTPFDGEKNKINKGNECKIETRCKREYIEEALKLIREIHPYEEPLVNVIPIMNSFFTK